MCIELHYFPGTAYLALLAQQPKVTLERHENFQKQTLRNRTLILTSQKVEALIVPIRHTASKILIDKVLVDDSQSWRTRHWRAIQSSYGRTPYFEYFAQQVYDILHLPSNLLWDIAEASLRFLLQAFEIQLTIEYTNGYEPVVDEDARNSITEKPQIVVGPYYQPFVSQFCNGLSGLDLLFCAGPISGRRHLISAKKSPLEAG